ncbi:MAG: hypothetical protein V4754_20535 [Pseudomonadota bacterium]
MSIWIDFLCAALVVGLPLGTHVRQQWERVAMRHTLVARGLERDADPVRPPPSARSGSAERA